MADYIEPQDRVKEYLEHAVPDWDVIATGYELGVEYNLIASDVKDVLNELEWHQAHVEQTFNPVENLIVEYAEGSALPWSITGNDLHALGATLGEALTLLAQLQLAREANA